MGNITVSSLSWESAGSQKKAIGKLTFSASYATGGDYLTISQLGLSVLKDLTINDSSGYAFDLVNSTPTTTARIKVFNGTGGSIGAASAGTPSGTNASSAVSITVGNGTVVNAIGFDGSGNLVCTGGGTITGTAAGQTFTGAALANHTHTLTGGASAEVTNGTDLSALVVDFVAYGY